MKLGTIEFARRVVDDLCLDREQLAQHIHELNEEAAGYLQLALFRQCERDEAREEIASLQRTIAVWQEKVGEARRVARQVLDAYTERHPQLDVWSRYFPWLTETENA